MAYIQSIFQKEFQNNNYLTLNFVFAFFPISFIIGSFVVNLNLLLFCCLGIYYLKSKIFRTKFDLSIKVIFLFFIIILFSTSLSFIKTLYFEGFDYASLERLFKSILFFRFFLLLIIIYLLSKFDILNFNYFFITAALSCVILSADIIYQYIFGYDIIGLKGNYLDNHGFFGDEHIAGGYIQRFAFFAIFLNIIFFKNTKYLRFMSTTILICILIAGIFFSGNRMPLILFLFGLFLIFFSKIEIKKILLTSFTIILIIFQFSILSNEKYMFYLSGSYHSLKESIKSIASLTTPERMIWKWTGRGEIPMKSGKVEGGDDIRTKTHFMNVEYVTPHKRLFMTAIETWKLNKIFGNGIKSFRVDCWKLDGRDDIYLGEDIMPGKRNLLCSNHPHNYYFEILTETGIVGFFITLTLAVLLIIFIIKNYKHISNINLEHLIILSALISLVLETFPIRSTGSLFTTNNFTYLILISSILISYEKILKIDNLR
tara:strand:- start:847 stop:2304 length:1458 start_codon:yes stop_codon:yes gene_type:complete